MATLSAPSKPLSLIDELLTGLRFDWLMAALGLWLLGGLYLDGWAHTHDQVESFFTPWHGVLYSGFLVQAGVLAGVFVRNLRRGQVWTQAMPLGYGLSLLGAGIFMVGGMGDMIWHSLLGIEIGVEALLSPTHLLLALGATLMVTGPLRAGLRRADSRWAATLPLFLSVFIVFSLFTFFTDYANPWGGTWITTFDRPGSSYTFAVQALGITQFLFQAALLTAVVLILLRNNKLRPGQLTILLTFNTILMIVMHEPYLAIHPAYLMGVGALGGLTGDIWFLILRPSIANVRRLRLFSVLLPFSLYLFYFLSALLTVGVWWSIHLWTGAIVLIGVMGGLISYLIVPSEYETVGITPV